MKEIFSLVFFLILINLSLAQNTVIPDANFEQELINLGYDSGLPNGLVPTSNINTITSIYLTQKNISDLTGIADFTALTQLYCTDNYLTSLDVSQNSSLMGLWCGGNQLTSLKFNSNLTALWCFDNQLTNIDITQNTSLTDLNISNNQITSLNTEQNTMLTQLICDTNQLNCLNVKNGNNTNLTIFSTYNNPGLSCINVDNVTWSTNNWIDKDVTASFSTTCSNLCIVGISNLERNQFASIYPNPNKGHFTVKANSSNQFNTIEIYNLLGKRVISSSFGDNSIEIDISNQPKGVYLLKIVSNNDIIIQKIIYD